jgi:hypothetical protein
MRNSGSRNKIPGIIWVPRIVPLNTDQPLNTNQMWRAGDEGDE